METKHLWNFDWKFLLDVLAVSFSVELLYWRTLESWSKSKVHSSKDLWSDDNLEIGVVSSSIPMVGNVTTIHDLSEDVSDIIVWNEVVVGKVVVQNISANSQVTIIEVVASRPSLGSELLSSEDERVEHTETEQEGLEFTELVALSSLEVFFWELREGSSQVRLQVGWSLIGNLDRDLQDRLWDDFQKWHNHWGWLRRHKASELWVDIVFKNNFKLSLKRLHPGLHEMDILKHNPLSSLSSICQASSSDFFLTLSHGNHNEGSIRHEFVLLSSNGFDIGSWVNTREQNEEDWCLW
jgi:hypothetical protein